MGRITNEKQKAWIAEVAARDKLKPKPKVVKPRKKVVVKDKKSNCCLDRYESLPEGFRPCIDCPKVSVADTGNGQKSSEPSTGAT